MYWTEAKKDRPQISAQRFDGSGRRGVMEGAPELAHPFSVTLFRDRLFWTDWHTRSARAPAMWCVGCEGGALCVGAVTIMLCARET